MHYRKTIRDAINTLLMGTVSYAGSALAVYRSRVIPFWAVELPCIAFYTHNDDSDNQKTAPRIYKHDYAVAIQVIIEEKNGIDTDDALDEITAIIETLFEQDITLGDKVDDLALTGTSFASKAEGKRTFTAAIMTWGFDYRRRAPETIPVGALEDFESADIQISIDGSSIMAIEAETEIQ
jgi:hypothetical protein